MNPNILHSPTMPFTPAHITEASNAANVPIIGSVPMDIDVKDPVAKAVAVAQEQLRVAMEAQARDWKRREFAEQYWQLQKADSRKMKVLDKDAAVEVSSVTVMLVESRNAHVSVQFFMAFISDVDLHFSNAIWSGRC